MKLSLELSPRFSDSRLQRLVENEERRLACGLLKVLVHAFIKHEQDRLYEQMSSFASESSWPKFAPDRLVGLIFLHKLHDYLHSLSEGSDFTKLTSVLKSIAPDLLSECIEGLLFAFQAQLNTFAMTLDDLDHAIRDHGTPIGDGKGISIGEDLFKSSWDSLRSRVPIYINAIAKDSDLQEAKQQVGSYLEEERKQGKADSTLKCCLMGYIKQLFQKGRWREESMHLLLGRVITYQRNNFPFLTDFVHGFVGVGVYVGFAGCVILMSGLFVKQK